MLILYSVLMLSSMISRNTTLSRVSQWKAKIQIYNQETYRDLFNRKPNDPFPDVFDAFLTHLGVLILPCRGQPQRPKSAADLGPGPEHITKTTLFYTPNLPFEVNAWALELRDPECYIGESLEALQRSDQTDGRVIQGSN